MRYLKEKDFFFRRRKERVHILYIHNRVKSRNNQRKTGQPTLNNKVITNQCITNKKMYSEVLITKLHV